MARPTSREKDPLSLAVIQMRRQLKMTQADLARALKVALPTVGRWESWNPPTGSTIERLGRFARAHGVDDTTFRKAIEDNMCPVSFAVSDWEEAHYVQALLETLRNPDLAAVLPKVRRALKPALKATESFVDDNKRLLHWASIGKIK
jgi:hypothetical protein